MPEKKEVTILLAEDDAGHARLIEKNLRRSGISNRFVIVDDGHKALDYLLGEGEYAQKEPDDAMLVMLDLNMPVMDGYQVLERVKADERTRHIPIVVLTTTDDSREVSRCYDMGCNVYITKPVDYERFCEAVRQLGLFLSVVSIPNGE